MYPNASKWVQIHQVDPNGYNLVQMGPVGFKSVQTGPNGSNWVQNRSKMGPNGSQIAPKCLKQDQFSPNRFKMIERLSFFYNSTNGPKIIPNYLE